MIRYDLTDFEWSVIEPLLPNKPRGVPRVDDRRVLNGIMWVLRSGAPWRDLPERYGPYTLTQPLGCPNGRDHLTRVCGLDITLRIQNRRSDNAIHHNTL